VNNSIEVVSQTIWKFWREHRHYQLETREFRGVVMPILLFLVFPSAKEVATARPLGFVPIALKPVFPPDVHIAIVSTTDWASTKKSWIAF